MILVQVKICGYQKGLSFGLLLHIQNHLEDDVT